MKYILAICLVAASVMNAAHAQFKQAIHLVVPYGAGASTDAMARQVAPILSRELGQAVVVDNKPGANGQIGSQFVKVAPADGSTFLFTLDHSVVVVPYITPDVPYSLKDFQVVGKVGRFQWVFVTPLNGPAKTMSEFIDDAKRDPTLRNYGVPIVGGVPQIMGEAVERKSGVSLTPVPFAGAATLMPQLMGGQLSSGIVGVGEALSMVKSGRVRLLGISGSKRSSMLPDVPTFEELGMPGVNLGTVYIVLAPRELPNAMAEKFNAALRLAVADANVQHEAKEMSIELESAGLAETQRELTSIADFWQHALKATK